MMRDALDWVAKNRDWLFSGVGVTIVIGLMAVFRRIRHRPGDLVGSEDDSVQVSFVRPKQQKLAEKDIYCSFCGKSQHEVKKLIAGPSVFICDECMDLCLDIVEDNGSSERVMKIASLTEVTVKAANPKISVTERANLQEVARALALQIRTRVRNHPGEIVAGCQLVRTIGSGNFATVWEAVRLGADERPTQETAAVKIFDQDKLAQGLMLWRFQRGVRAMKHFGELGGLTPSSIVRLYAIGDDGLSFSMQYLPGGDLQDIARRGFSLEKKLSLFFQVTRAVEFSHAHHVIHRDIKPANIVIDTESNAVLTDFDIADLHFAQTQSMLSSSLGTPLFAAPEQLAGTDLLAHPTADVYSLGKLLYFMLSERPPPMGSTDSALLPTYLQTEAIPLSLREPIAKAIRFEPNDRYSSVTDFASACRNALQRSTEA